jgi:hypothetical protein
MLLCLCVPPLAIGDPSALLRDTDDTSQDGAPYAGLPTPSAASRGRSAAAAAAQGQAVNAGKVNLTEVRLQLQRQLKQQVRLFCEATRCNDSTAGASCWICFCKAG